MLFSKKYSQKETLYWCNRYENEVLDFTQNLLVNFAESINTKLKDLENELYVVAIANTEFSKLGQADKLKEIELIKTVFKKEAVNKLLSKSRVELKNEVLEVLMRLHKYSNSKEELINK